MMGLTRNYIKKIIILKIDLPALLAFALFAGLIFFFLIPGFEKAMMDRKRVLIHEITSTAFSVLEYYHSLETKGNLESKAAKEQAMMAISTIRYGETRKDYFWITDKYPRMIVHPYRPDLNGKDLTEFHDSKGKAIFVEFVQAVSKGGESYVDYMWQWNDDSTRIVPKLSYVKLFEPWDWIIGTGIYTEDVRLEIRSMENRALIISGIIGIIIIVLLNFISRQSHRIEEKRKHAEEEVKKSRELYRTLAEAASEGVLIWSEQGLQANKTLLSWLGYTEEELSAQSFRNIFESPEMPNMIDPGSLYEELDTRRFVEGFLTAKSGNRIISHADLSRILLVEMKAVLLVIRPLKTNVIQPDLTPQSMLLDNIDTGFFRTSYGKKIRFIYASQPAITMLGFADFQELHQYSIEAFFLNSMEFNSFKTSLAARDAVLEKPLLLRRKGGDTFWAQVSVMVVESDTREIWCEGTIERLAASSVMQNIIQRDFHLYSAAYVLDAPVTTIMRSPVTCTETTTASRSISIMKENHADSLIVTNKDGEPMGIINASAIGYRLAEGASTETEVFRWMNAPPDMIRHDAPVNEAFFSMKNSAHKCLLVKSVDQSITGMITLNDLNAAFFNAPQRILNSISKAGSVTALHQAFDDGRKIASSMLLGRGDPYAVSLVLSEIADAICKQVINLCLEKAGAPPCRFAFIQTGSAGRREQTFSTDQDNALIFENCSGEGLKTAEAYFHNLGNSINEMMSLAGYRLCKGNNMARNPLWCKTLDGWKQYFADWINAPGPQELLDVCIFFDFRFCFGDEHLPEALREFVQTSLKTNDIFFHHMASAWKPFNPSLSQLSAGNLDTKKLLMPLTGIIRLYSLKYHIIDCPTIDRIIELHTGKHLSSQLLRETLSAWKNISTLRFMHQVECIGKGAEPDNMIDLRLPDKNISGFTEQAIRAINNLMLKAGSDFYTDTI